MATSKQIKPLKPPIPYFGGKSKLARSIIDLMPPHRTYVEPFGGSGAVLLAKPRSPVEVYNDIDGDLVNFYRVLQDEQKAEKFRRIIEFTPYSKQVFEEARQAIRTSEFLDEIDRAVKFFVVAAMSFSGEHRGGWSWSVRDSQAGISASVRRFLTSVERLEAVHNRLRGVQIECADFREIFKRYDHEDALFYADPPYVPETRKEGTYRYEMTRKDHEELVDILLRLRGMAILSGYENEVYLRLEKAGWKKIILAETRSNASNKRTRRVEMVWLSPGVVKNPEVRLF
ncbi:MAG: DNA adenine methylase [Brockia lithotrophica]|nr:DNA adenine methylase [Brockia lithotrophica]